MRPGISADTLARAGVKRVSAEEAKALSGAEQSGLWLPYRTVDGAAICDGGKAYGRLRLDQPQGSKKYHQASGTSVHVYVPPTLDTQQTGAALFCIEGEFKSLALTEAGFAAIGVSGFYGFHEKGGGKLLPEFAEVLERLKPSRIFFCGDSDTALNYQFSDAAIRLAKLVNPIPVLLPRIPLNGPGKGADDCRAELNASFDDWWRERIGEAVSIKPDHSVEQLALELFEREHGAFASLGGSARHEAERRMVKLAAAMRPHPLLQGRILTFAERTLKIPLRALNKAVKDALDTLSGGDDEQNDNQIDHSDQASLWTRQVWGNVSDSLFLYSKQICRLYEGRLEPQGPAAMVSFLDNPERCRFMTKTREGKMVASSFSEADARVFMGSWMNALDLVRSVDVFSHVPVLAWNGKEAVLVNGYDKELKILAGGEAIELPTPAEAVERLVSLLRDYEFVTPGDFGRAISLLLSPALAQGGFLGRGRVPLFLVEKNEPNAGGSLLLKLTCGIYGLKPQPISKLDRPERVVEDLSRLLLSGAGFIYFDNARGRGLQNLPELESVLTEPNFNCRAPYQHGEADVTRRVFAVSSNGAVFSRDLATRTVKITIRKKAPGFRFFEYAEGSIEDHVAANSAHYLAAVFSLVKDWAAAGRPAGQRLSGCRFNQWERGCASILEKHFPGLPLLDKSHQEAQDRLADPDHDLVRNLFRLVIEGETRGQVTASSLAEMGEHAGLLEGTEQQNRLRVGKAMKRRFPIDGPHTFDSGRFTVVRDTRKSQQGNGHDVAFYEIRAGAEVQ